MKLSFSYFSSFITNEISDLTQLVIELTLLTFLFLQIQVRFLQVLQNATL